MTKAYIVFVSGGYESDMEFGTFKSEDEAEKLRQELALDWEGVEVGPVTIWDSLQEMKDHNNAQIAEWERLNPEL